MATMMLDRPRTEIREMKASVFSTYGPPDVLQLNVVAKPIPKANEVLVRVCAAAVSSTDVNLRQGDPLMRLVFGLRRPRKPVLGTELAGEIEAIGKDVRRFREGDRVYAATGAGFGAHAEYLCLPEDGALAPMPANMTFAEAAAICEGGLTALPFLRDTGKIQRGHQVLINGASGAVGNMAVQLAKVFGADATGVCGPANVDLVRSLGADAVIDYTREDFTRSGQTYDIIFTAPRFDAEGKLLKSGYLTVLHNGVLIQNHTEIEGTTAWDQAPKYTAHPEKLPLLLQHHRNPVRFRNIWIREL